MSLTHNLFSDTYRDMQRALALMDDPFFNSRRALGHSRSPSLARYPATDMVENEDSFELHAELPGIDKKNIEIELADSQTLVLKGSINSEYKSSSEDQASSITKTESSGEVAQKSSAPSWWVNERVSGSFTRSFTFPAPINGNEIKATYQDGVLKIVVPKATKQTKRIHVE
ncbi:HSP20-like chaperone [Pilobolus umbonatus]|nr:HSP20-like chaperone [Pilobolus umbonatus]